MKEIFYDSVRYYIVKNDKCIYVIIFKLNKMTKEALK